MFMISMGLGFEIIVFRSIYVQTLLHDSSYLFYGLNHYHQAQLDHKSLFLIYDMMKIKP
jgi:hypothetical protein